MSYDLSTLALSVATPGIQVQVVRQQEAVIAATTDGLDASFILEDLLHALDK